MIWATNSVDLHETIYELEIIYTIELYVRLCAMCHQLVQIKSTSYSHLAIHAKTLDYFIRKIQMFYKFLETV